MRRPEHVGSASTAAAPLSLNELLPQLESVAHETERSRTARVLALASLSDWEDEARDCLTGRPPAGGLSPYSGSPLDPHRGLPPRRRGGNDGTQTQWEALYDVGIRTPACAGVTPEQAAIGF